jgi:transcriptional regulator with XRE-family HTH domain
LENPINYQIVKRKEEMYNFYYKGVGDRIKKRRLELNYTQETLARGICSNTYVSKIENNRVVPNQEQLLLIMEKMDMSLDEIGMPFQIVDYLEQSVEYFFFKDIDSYAKLFKKISNLEFSSLVYIIRLGYFILTENYEEAKIYYDEIARYYNSLEDYGFATFLIYGCFYNIGINDYQSARHILDLIKGKLRNDERLYALYSFQSYIVYGFLNMPNSALITIDIAKNIFIIEGNTKRNIEVLMYMNIFRAMEGTLGEPKINKDHLLYLSTNQKNYYLLVLSINSDRGEEYINLMDNQSPLYLEALFLKALEYYKQEKHEEFNKIKNRLVLESRNSISDLDYLELIKFYETNNKTMIKEYLINFRLPYMIKKQNVYMINLISLELESIFSDKNRYKDAITYRNKCRNEIMKLQTALET